MNSITFKNVSEGIKSLALSVAVVGGGVWAFYEFAALESIAMEKQKLLSLQKSNHEFADIRISIDASAASVGENNRDYIIGAVEIENLGNRMAFVDLDPNVPPLKVARVEYSEVEEMFLFLEDDGFHFTTMSRMKSIVISLNPREIHSLPFAIPIDRSGLYMISFSSLARPEDNLILQKDSDDIEITPIYWFRQLLVLVKEDT